MGHSLKSAVFLIESRIAQAATGDVKALFDLGVAYSTGSGGIGVDLIEAHNWFNLAALNGSIAARPSQSGAKAAAILAWFERYRDGAPPRTAAATQ